MTHSSKMKTPFPRFAYNTKGTIPYRDRKARSKRVKNQGSALWRRRIKINPTITPGLHSRKPWRNCGQGRKRITASLCLRRRVVSRRLPIVHTTTGRQPHLGYNAVLPVGLPVTSSSSRSGASSSTLPPPKSSVPRGLRYPRVYHLLQRAGMQHVRRGRSQTSPDQRCKRQWEPCCLGLRRSLHPASSLHASPRGTAQIRRRKTFTELRGGFRKNSQTSLCSLTDPPPPFFFVAKRNTPNLQLALGDGLVVPPDSHFFANTKPCTTRHGLIEEHEACRGDGDDRGYVTTTLARCRTRLTNRVLGSGIEEKGDENHGSGLGVGTSSTESSLFFSFAGYMYI